ncbi:MAG: hypothetical protein GEU99_11000 [Luteitalea sp.]|nr:hypothetical protein [Luteitalea sp.]
MQDYYRILDPIWGARRGPMRRPATPGRGRVGRQRPAWRDRLHPEERIIVTRVTALSRDVRWFGDEVAVDFPSAAAVVERVRGGFFETAESRSVAAICIVLTGIEAQRGGRMPIRLSLATTCGACGGRGESWGARCESCTGEGSALRWRYLVFRMPPGLRDGDSLQFRLRDPNAPTQVTVRVSVR